MQEPQKSDHQLIEQLLETLQGLPNVSASLRVSATSPQNSGRFYGTSLLVTIGGNSVTVILEAKKAAFPRDIREMLWHLKQSDAIHAHEDYRGSAVPMLVAESISTGAKQLLQEERVAYFDIGGSLFLSTAGAYIFIDKPTPKALAKSIRSFFMGRRAQVLQVLLHKPHEWFGVKALAEQAMVSPATASETLTALERFDWVISRGQGPAKERCLEEPKGLLDAWAKQVVVNRQSAMRRYFVPSANSDRLLDRLAQVCEAHGAEYAVTHEAGAQRYAPFLSNVSQIRCRLLNDHAGDEAVRALDARIVNEGANLVVIEAKSHGEFLFRERVGDVWLASPVQVYLDLLRGEGRAMEMAEHLRKERIRF